MKAEIIEMLDLTGPKGPMQVEVQVRANGLVLYVHVEGMSVLRICQVKEFTLKTTDKEFLINEHGKLVEADES
jgi:hypothetical protein